MAKLQIWAPRVRKMEIEIEGERLPMEPAAEGWHCFEDECLKHEVDYALWLDGEGPFPDPRSGHQPDGYAGPSRYVDHSRFEWNDAFWQPRPWSDAIVYELHVGTFTPAGTFVSAIEKLDYLAELGVTHVELLPIAEFPGDRGWGYDGVHLFAPHHRYGGPEGLKQLVDACHRRGLAVILDVVYNHLGPRGNHLPRFAPYFTDHYHTPWGMAVNVDGRDSDEVRRFFIDNAMMWLRDYHIDGLRLDATDTIVDNSALPFLEQLSCSVAELETSLGRQFVLVAESSLNDPRLVRPVERCGLGLDAQWNEDYHHAVHTLLTGEKGGYYLDFGTLGDLARVLGAGFCYDHRYSRYRRHHYGRPAVGVGGTQLVACIQNHDQVGNRPAGERLGHLVDAERLKLGAALTLLSPFVPMLFMGEEWNASTPFLYFTDFADPELGAAIFKGRKQEARQLGLNPSDVVDPQSETAWRRSHLQWQEVEEPTHGEILEWYRTLIRLRKSQADFRAGPLDPSAVVCDERERWLRLRRGSKLVLCNFSDEKRAVPLGTSAPYDTLLVSGFCEQTAPAEHVALPPWGVAVLALEGDLDDMPPLDTQGD